MVLHLRQTFVISFVFCTTCACNAPAPRKAARAVRAKKQTNKQTQITNNNKKVMQKRGLHEVLPKLQFKENYRKSSIKSRQRRPPPSSLTGGLIETWGLFNLGKTVVSVSHKELE